MREYKDYLAGKESRPICVSRYFHRYATNSVKLPNNEACDILDIEVPILILVSIG